MLAPSPFALARDTWTGAARSQWASPGQLAMDLDPKTTRQTPALDAIDKALVDVYEGRNDRLVISMPPQEGKSQRASRRFPAWCLYRNPELRVALASYELRTARRWGKAVRDDITTHPARFSLTIDRLTSAANDWQISGHAGGMYSVGIGGPFTGRPVDLLIIDDPIKDRAQAESEAHREMVWEWWTDVAAPRLAPGAPVVLILTRWHEDDLAGRLVKDEEGRRWQVLNIPAQADHRPERGERDPLGRDPGQWMVSARGRTVEQWEQKRLEVGSRTFTSLYQGRPAPSIGEVWLRPWWRRYGEHLWRVEDGTRYLVDADEVLMSWDMAFKDTKGSDFVVGQVWARRGVEVFLLDQLHKRLTFTETVKAFQALVAKWPQANLKLVEDKANGTAVIDQLRRKVPGLVPENPTDSKYGRAASVAPFIEAGNVLLPDDDVALFDVDELIDEAAAFPNATHDDQVDATSQALRRLLLRPGQGQAWLQHLRNRRQEGGATDGSA